MGLLLKPMFSSLRHVNLADFGILFRPFGFVTPRNFLFSNFLASSVPDEGYSRKASWELN